MKTPKKLPKWAFISLCVVCAAAMYTVSKIANYKLRQMTLRLNEYADAREAYETSVDEIAEGELDHDTPLYGMKDKIVDFTDEETEQLYEAFDIVIPENEPNIRPRLLGTECHSYASYYYLEFDGINDRKAFYDANKYDRKRFFEFGDNWKDVGEDGEYTHYFSVSVQFKSGKEQLKSPNIIKIKPLYEEMLSARF